MGLEPTMVRMRCANGLLAEQLTRGRKPGVFRSAWELVVALGIGMLLGGLALGMIAAMQGCKGRHGKHAGYMVDRRMLRDRTEVRVEQGGPLVRWL